jgi:hemerythrin-like domain-containing protein
MERVATYPHDGAGRGETFPGLRANPLDQIADEHMEQRVMCSDLENLVQCTHPTQARAIAILTHLTTVLPRHIADEEDDLFPLLRRRAAPDDDIQDTLKLLLADHDKSDTMLSRVVRALRRVLSLNTAFTDGEVADAMAFAAHERRHLIVENAIVLPLARGLLTKDDLTTLRLRMALRRSAPDSEET